MKRTLATITVLFMLAACPAFVAQEKQEKEEPKGPLTGAWKCVSHAPEQPDRDFQLDLEQRGEKVTGTGSISQGSAPLKGAFENGKFKLVVEGGEGKYELEGQLEEDKISGNWSFSGTGAKGTFEGKRA